MNEGSGARPAKIVFVNRYFHPDESATSRMLSDLAFRLADRGIPVAIVTSRQLYEDARARLPAQETVQGVTVHRIATSTLGRARLPGRALDYASFHLAAALQLARILEPGDIVVAKTDPPLISVVTGLMASWRGAVLVNWLQDVFPEVAAALAPGMLPHWLQAVLVRMRDASLRRAVMNVVIGEGMRTRLLARGIGADRIRVIPNWADTQAIAPLAPGESQTRARLGLNGKFVLGYSGNFGRSHEFHTLLAAARHLQGDLDFAFLMTGGGARASQLREAVERASLTSFHFQRYQPAQLLSDSMAAADIHLVSLLPALEGLILPSKVYGILAAGRPVVFIGDIDGDVARLLREHDCGISVPVGDGARLAKQLRVLEADPERLRSMGANARRLAVTRCTSDIAAADWLDLLAQLWCQKPVAQPR